VADGGLATIVVCAGDEAPQPDVAVRLYVVVAWGWAISTNPDVPDHVPMPAIDTVTPVPDGSVSDHDRRTVCAPPIVTELGVAVKKLIPGAKQELAVTVV